MDPTLVCAEERIDKCDVSDPKITHQVLDLIHDIGGGMRAIARARLLTERTCVRTASRGNHGKFWKGVIVNGDRTVDVGGQKVPSREGQRGRVL